MLAVGTFTLLNVSVPLLVPVPPMYPTFAPPEHSAQFVTAAWPPNVFVEDSSWYSSSVLVPIGALVHRIRSGIAVDRSLQAQGVAAFHSESPEITRRAAWFRRSRPRWFGQDRDGKVEMMDKDR